ncbi:hypothetical protein PENTCL1PPCAC_29362, partial [Pristionchus entomophagus]
PSSISSFLSSSSPLSDAEIGEHSADSARIGMMGSSLSTDDEAESGLERRHLARRFENHTCILASGNWVFLTSSMRSSV